MILCARKYDNVNRARNADHAARTCERFVYSIVKILKDFMIIKRDRHIFREIHEVCRGLWAFFVLIVLFGC